MKTILLIVVSFLTLNTYAINKEISIHAVDPDGIPRSIVQSPYVWQLENPYQLEIQFAIPFTSFTLIVTDKTDTIVFQVPLITDGNKHTYTLPPLPQDVYRIKIESGKKLYEGEIVI